MSYILDAIKKSEAERGQGSIPGLQTVHSSSLNYKTSGKQIWPYILIGLLVLNGAGLLFHFSQSSNIPTETDKHKKTTREVIVTSPMPTAPQPAVTRIIQPTTQPKQIIISPPATANAVPITSARKQQALTNVDIVNIEDLPDNIKQFIPSMDFTGHVYSSSAAQRSIIINGDFLEEGDKLNNNVFLSEITPKGAVFNYQGVLFEVSVISGWN